MLAAVVGYQETAERLQHILVHTTVIFFHTADDPLRLTYVRKALRTTSMPVNHHKIPHLQHAYSPTLTFATGCHTHSLINQIHIMYIILLAIKPFTVQI